MTALFPSRRAFTLIELLVVIAIIAVLITLLFPAADAAFEQAKRARAKNDASQIGNAITGYLSEYGKLPADGAGNVNNANLMNILAGINTDDMNPREVVFLEVPKAKQGKNGADSAGGDYTSGYRDAWDATTGDNLYEIRVDNEDANAGYDGKVKFEGDDIRKSVIVWSKGNPKKTSYSDKNKWIKSWE
jgi:prepilin-type N-terminal cleavage/methylation domain-containing protein